MCRCLSMKNKLWESYENAPECARSKVFALNSRTGFYCYHRQLCNSYVTPCISNLALLQLKIRNIRNDTTHASILISDIIVACVHFFSIPVMWFLSNSKKMSMWPLWPDPPSIFHHSCQIYTDKSREKIMGKFLYFSHDFCQCILGYINSTSSAESHIELEDCFDNVYIDNNSL